MDRITTPEEMDVLRLIASSGLRANMTLMAHVIWAVQGLLNSDPTELSEMGIKGAVEVDWETYLAYLKNLDDPSSNLG